MIVDEETKNDDLPSTGTSLSEVGPERPTANNRPDRSSIRQIRNLPGERAPPGKIIFVWCVIAWTIFYSSSWYLSSDVRFSAEIESLMDLPTITLQKPEPVSLSTEQQAIPLPSFVKPHEAENATIIQFRQVPPTPSLPSNDKEVTPLPSHGTKNIKCLVTAMIIEVECNPALSLILKQAATLLGPEFRIVVYHSPHNQRFVRGLIESDPQLQQMFHTAIENGNSNTPTTSKLAMQEIHKEDYGSGKRKQAYTGRYWYSRMLTNQTFWESITTPYALILQSDTLLCRPFPTHEFLSRNESFVGGLSGFIREPANPIPVTANPIPNATIKYRHLNGGLSLRNVQWVIRCIQQFNDLRQPIGWVEDSLYRRCQESEIPGTVHVSERQAYSFASDNGRTLCFNSTATSSGKQQQQRIIIQRTCPVGVHKPWTDGITKWGREAYCELVQNCPGLDILERLGTNKDDIAKHAVRGEVCQAYDIYGKFTPFKCHCG